MKVETLPIDKVIPYYRNPRKNEHAVDKVASSIREFGFRQPIVVDPEYTIIAGHTRYLAAQKLGLAEVPIHRAEGLTKAQIKAYRIADNRVGQEATWDNELLNLELVDLQDLDFDLNLTGFNPEELDALLNIEEIAAQGDEDAVPDVPVEPRAKRGDVWILGSHRVMCGDSANVDDVDKLMDGRLVNLVFTDPPYNFAGEIKDIGLSDIRKSYKNLEQAEWDKDFKVEPFLNAMLPFLAKGASVFACTSQYLFGDIFNWMRASLDYANYCVWCKPNPMPSLTKRRFTWATELVCYGTKDGHTFNFPKEGHALSYLLETSPSHTTEHPTEKPVKVPEHFILLTSKKNDLVLDLFGGSGSALIACEKNQRVCYTLELDAKYVDVIVKRWQEYTGKRAVLESTGEEF
jgi:DNA modification methylase